VIADLELKRYLFLFLLSSIYLTKKLTSVIDVRNQTSQLREL